MKRIICTLLSISMLFSNVFAYNFVARDWGKLLGERKVMVTEAEFELYGEAKPDDSVYYGARLEPKAGAYIGMISETSEPFAPVGSYLTYIDNMRQPDLYYPANVLISRDNVVATVGWTVDNLGSVNYEYIREVLNTLNTYNKPMFIRFANEMNVSPIGDEPSTYVNIFRNVANMVHEYDNFSVVWSPNDLGALDRPYELYYPGDEYVDWIGVSMYMIKYFQGKKNTQYKDSVYFMTGDYGYATNRIKPIMEFMEKNNIRKPVMISEGGVPTNNKFGEDLTEWATPRFDNFLWYLVMKYPQIKLINYFNNHRPNENERYDITGYKYAEDAFMRAKNSGAYITEYNGVPEFVFRKFIYLDEFIEKDGIINLYTYAYFEKTPAMTVTYRLNGEWYHASSQIPYKCALDTSRLNKGENTISISANGHEKTYTFVYNPKEATQTPEVNDRIRVFADGKEVTFDVPPVIHDGRTLIPLRACAEALGADVEWIAETQTAAIIQFAYSIFITIGEKEYIIDDLPYPIDVPAQIIDGRTLVPVRAISEGFGAKVTWDAETRTVYIDR